MFYRENGQFKTSYRADQQIFTPKAASAMIKNGIRIARNM